METISEDAGLSKPDGLKTILLGALVAGILDITAASVISWLRSGRGALSTYSFQSVVTGILIHIFCVGLPIALIVRQFGKSEN